jgi:hypothetical protein
MSAVMGEKKDRNLKATRLGQEAHDFIIKNSNKRFSRGMRLQTAWEAVAPQRALQYTDNVVFSPKSKDSTILVYVANSHWAAELGTQKELYRILLERETGWELSDIKFLVTRKTAFKKIFKKRELKKEQEAKERHAIPLTDEEDGYARDMVSQIKNEELKKRLYKAVKADFEWKKGSEGLKLPQKSPESPETR